MSYAKTAPADMQQPVYAVQATAEAQVLPPQAPGGMAPQQVRYSPARKRSPRRRRRRRPAANPSRSQVMVDDMALECGQTYGCFDDCGSCCLGMFCPCILFGQTILI